MSDRHWMQDAFAKHPGLLSRHAKKAGESTQEYAQEHAGDSGKEGQRARLAITAKKIARGYVAAHERK